jgi:uncharacterized protein YaaW (UPF0174 family)
MDSQLVTRRRVLVAGMGFATWTTVLKGLSFAQPNSPRKPTNPADAFVQPQTSWTEFELNQFLGSLSPQALLSVKKALDLVRTDATEDSLKGSESDVADIQKQLLRISSNVFAYYLWGDQKRIKYHELVRWAAENAGVDQWIVESQPTFVIERAIHERVFHSIWGKLDLKKGEELIAKIDVHGKIPDDARRAIAALDEKALFEKLNEWRSQGDKITDMSARTAIAGATLAATADFMAYFTGFAFYQTMSVTICTVAEWFGLTLPFAAYAGASTLVAFLTGPVGWALVAVALAAGLAALYGRADVKKTTAVICQLHALKVAALEAAGKKDESIFMPLGRRGKVQ